ncbi:L-threonylcarbamoyladenylate synthase [Halobacteria archaeon HArc-gm2]|nr:L-threonylcarbamoyladenylate synthase [Halobacteria archaeon HArc-gm2]
MTDIERATEAVDDGDLVVYPTETVYGLGADALDPDAVERVFAAKGRDPDDPLSLGVPDVDTALEYANPTEREERFMRAFLPGPVTVVVERGDQVPDELTGGRDRVGIRIPEHELARDLLAAAGPLTATSANVSGNSSARSVDELDDEIREAAAVVLDGGETLGAESTVVDVGEGEILRDGGMVTAVQMWLRSEE